MLGPVSTERLYYKKGDVSMSENFADLTRNYESGLFSKRQHVLKRFLHTSYEKLIGEKEVCHGSVPAIPATVLEDSAIMDTTISSPSRLTSFLIRKGLKADLKRAKSATKLERKTFGVTTPEPENSTFVGTLKRSMSLGRLTRKRTRSKSTDNDAQKVQEQQSSAINSQLKSCYSHESLLSDNPLLLLDLTSPDMEIRSLHSSILQQDHCFQVSTMNGSKYISCRTTEERDKWVQSLRRTVSPQLENSRRSELSLKIWIVEAKNVPAKKNYFCEIFLDKNLYARTSVKSKGDMLFWGEQFEFNNLPKVEYIFVNLYREADKKKKKDKNMLVCYTKIAMTDVSKRQYVEKWFSTHSGIVGKNGKENKTDLPLIRLKVRHQTVQILPIDFYKALSQYIGNNYASLCDTLEPLVNIRDKEEIATSLIKIMQKLNKSNVFLSEVVMAEVLRLDNNHLTFRGNSIATKSMEAHMKLVGEKYLRDTLADFVRTIIESEDDCEVDPTKVPVPAMIARHQTNLRMYCDMAWTKIFTSFSLFPRELINVFSSFRAKCVEQNKADLGDNLISASIFLRYLCPAIMSPSLFHLTQEFPSEKAARNLTLIAKTIQTLANFSKFGSKEEYMTFMNEFVELEWNNMKLFLQKISTPGHYEDCTEFDGDIDFGKEMSILHTLLTDSLEKASEEALQKLDNLPKILAQITNDLQNPSLLQHQSSARKSVHYDNLVNIQAHIDLVTSPTELMNDSLNQCDDSYIKLPIGSNGVIVSASNQRTSNDLDPTVLNSTENVVSSKNVQLNSEVSNVSVTSRSKLNESHVNKSWNQMVSAAEIINGEYIDLISFMDEDGNHSSKEIECNGNGSHMSTMLSSSYHSFEYSQGNDLVDTEKDNVNHLTERSPNNYAYSHSTPLSFSNPMYRLNHRGLSSHLNSTSSLVQVSRSSSLSSDEVVTLEPLCSNQGNSSEKQQTGDKEEKVTPRFFKSCSSPSMSEKIRIAHNIFNNPCTINNTVKDKLPSHSQLNNDVHMVNGNSSDRPKYIRSSSNVSFSNRFKESVHFSSMQNTTSPNSNAKYPLNLRSSTPVMKHSSTLAPHNVSNYAQYSNTIGSTPRRIHELSHSVDYSFMTQQQHYADAIRRTAKETVLQRGTGSLESEKSFQPSPKEQFSDDCSLLGSFLTPNALPTGVRSVQQWLQPQDRSKDERESEVSVLKQQLVEAQERLKMAEEKLQEHESEAHLTAAEWQIRLQESEERMRKQQAEKDDQMKNIIQRLFHVEDELRMEQAEMQKMVEQKQKVIKAQEQHIQTLDIANNHLVLALNQFKDHYNMATKNGMTGSITRKLAADISSFKTSSC